MVRVHGMLDKMYLLCPGSAEMLSDMGIPWVILGHSERRSLIGESSDVSGHCLNACMKRQHMRRTS